jgi:insulysin
LKKFIFLFFLSLTPFIGAEEEQTLPSYQPIVDQCGLAIETPTFSKREVRKLRLENGLEVFLVSDPNTHESGAALAVEVGSWDDPIDRPGMAHFVEHLLFLGTEKYPEEEGYSRYLNEHGGLRNAFTMADRTVYIFSVNNDGFLGALDRFGQFFIAPLFSPSGVDRECKAIHQEYSRNVPLDPWRVHYVKKELANKQHPFHHFCIGNEESLAKISQGELKAWYASHYSSNLMHLVVYSSLDLETLEKEVVTLFSQVKNLNIEPAQFKETMLIRSPKPQLCVVTPVQELQLLELSWEIPRFFGQDTEIHADELLSYVLGHEGSTSLLAQLKRENLAEALGVENYRAGHDQCLLSLTIELTSKGVKEYETVIQRCFEALASLRQSGIPRYIFDEVCQIGTLKYRFQSREDVFDLVSDHATRMVDEPLETYPRKTLIPSSWVPEKVSELIASLQPSTCFMTLLAPEALTKISPTFTERWLGVQYALKPIASKQMEKWEKASHHPAISVPRPNPFLPSDLKIKGEQTAIQGVLPKPSLISDEAKGKIYVAQDTEFLIPEISWTFSFKTPCILDGDPTSQVLADFYCHTINENLKAASYEALKAGLAYSLEPKHGAIELQITGYSDKAADLLNKVVKEMRSVSISREQFALYKEQLTREYSNALNQTPLKQAKDMLSTILYKDFSSLQQKSAALEKITCEQVKGFCRIVLQESYVEGMLYGNLTTEEGELIWSELKQTLPFSPYPKEKHHKVALANLPAQEHPAYLAISSKNPANALILTMDCGNFSFKRRAAQEILTKGLEEPFFSELRTRQQTAYLVSNWSQELERHLYNFFAIQSSSHDTRDLLARFELFIESSLQELKDTLIPEERFEAIRTAQIEQLAHPAENLGRMGSTLHLIAFQYDGDFEWMEKRIQAFKDLTYEEFITLANEFLGKHNTKRLAICVNGKLPKSGNISYRHVTTPEKLRGEIAYEGRATDREGISK